MSTRQTALFILVGTAAVTISVVAASARPQFRWRVGNYPEEVRHSGPDSARVSSFLAAAEQADPVVCELLSDQIGSVWWSDAAYGLGQLADARGDVRRIKDSVSHPVRDAAAIGILTRRMAAPDPCMRRLVARMLGNSTVDDEALSRLLRSTDARVREAAVLAIAEQERPALYPVIEALLTDRDEGVVAMAAYTLGDAPYQHAMTPLIAVAGAKSARLRAAAVWALGEFENTGAVPALIRALSDGDAVVRRQAASALGKMDSAGSEAAVAPLTRALNDVDSEVRRAAAAALGDIKGG